MPLLLSLPVPGDAGAEGSGPVPGLRLCGVPAAPACSACPAPGQQQSPALRRPEGECLPCPVKGRPRLGSASPETQRQHCRAGFWLGQQAACGPFLFEAPMPVWASQDSGWAICGGKRGWRGLGLWVSAHPMEGSRQGIGGRPPLEQEGRSLGAPWHLPRCPRRGCFSSQRPIVEFSLEDGRKLKLKEQRAERSLVGHRGHPPTAAGMRPSPRQAPGPLLLAPWSAPRGSVCGVPQVCVLSC